MRLDDDSKMQLPSSKRNWDMGVTKSVCSTPPGNVGKFSGFRNM